MDIKTLYEAIDLSPDTLKIAFYDVIEALKYNEKNPYKNYFFEKGKDVGRYYNYIKSSNNIVFNDGMFSKQIYKGDFAYTLGEQMSEFEKKIIKIIC